MDFSVLLLSYRLTWPINQQGVNLVGFYFRTLASPAKCFALGLLLLTSGCSQTSKIDDDKSQNSKQGKFSPPSQTIKIRNPDTSNPTESNDQFVDRKLFNIVINKKSIWVNNGQIESIEALEALLSRNQNAVFTIASHKCTSNDKAAKIMALAQQYTDSPIAYASYGNYHDSECQ